MVARRAVLVWIVLAGFVTVVAGVAYVGIQQHLRGDANHPQVEMARAAVSSLNAGASPQAVVPAGSIDIGTSDEPFLIVVDASGAVLATSARLDGDSAVPPTGVFDFVRSHGEDVVTWQPAPYARSAIVVDSFHGGYVVAGRSLRATENQEQALGLWALAGWSVGVVVAGALALVVARRL